jgi:BlaI family penicillinase repressor
LQLSVLRSLWNRGEARVHEVHDDLAAERPLAQNTVATVLTRLEKHGLVCHRGEGRQFVYRALLAEEQAQENMVKELAERVFEGDYSRMFAHLLGRAEVDPGDLAIIKQQIDERARELAREGGQVR